MGVRTMWFNPRTGRTEFRDDSAMSLEGIQQFVQGEPPVPPDPSPGREVREGDTGGLPLSSFLFESIGRAFQRLADGNEYFWGGVSVVCRMWASAMVGLFGQVARDIFAPHGAYRGPVNPLPIHPSKMIYPVVAWPTKPDPPPAPPAKVRSWHISETRCEVCDQEMIDVTVFGDADRVLMCFRCSGTTLYPLLAGTDSTGPR